MNSTNNCFISVIVPCFNVEEFVEECLESIFAQSFQEFEVIVVDDASTDTTAEKIDGFAGDVRLRKISLAENIGLGSVRNLAISRARGDYLLFVDSDDWLVPNALSELINAAREASPDMVIFDYARVFPRLGALKSPHGQKLCELRSITNTHEGRMGLLDLPTMACFRLYRRQFIANQSVRFGGGYYEDVFWSYALTVAATNIQILPSALYCYRHRKGSILNSTDDRHMDLIDEYRRLLGFRLIAKDPRFRQKILDRTLEHYEFVLFTRSHRLSWAGRLRFLEAAHEQLQRRSSTEITNAIMTSKRLGPQLKRRAIMSGKRYRYLLVFLAFKCVRVLKLPFKVLRAIDPHTRLATSSDTEKAA